MSSFASASPTLCRCVTIVAKRSKKSLHRQKQKNSGKSPPRITSNVKLNLQFLKLSKEHQNRAPSIPKPATRYRRKKLENEDLPLDKDLSQNPTMSIDYEDEEFDSEVPVFLVDGYNMCGYWEKLKKHFMNGKLSLARQELIDELVSFSLARDVRVVVVFDAMGSGLPTHKYFMGVEVVYAGEMSADFWIEQEVVNLREDGCRKVWVVTSDNDQQHVANGAGAVVWSCKALVYEINTLKKELDEMNQRERFNSMGAGLLKNTLPPELVDVFRDMRKQLLEQESKKPRSVKGSWLEDTIN
ncbi:hypothetical protein Droror1_Dr00015214 [Drosera rotundifolia]